MIQEKRTSNLQRRPSGVQRRRGISLLEVLVAIGVLSGGLLLLATLMPIGFFYNSQAEQADRSGDCARAAFRDLEAYDMLRVDRWLWEPSGGWPNSSLPPYPQASPVRPYADLSRPAYVPTFMLDPNGVAANLQTPDAARWFPFAPITPMAGGLPRLTLADLMYGPPDPNNNNVRPQLTPDERLAAADRVFTCRDDVSLTGEGQSRPSLKLEKNPSNQQLTGRAPIKGDYSWMAMVTAAAVEDPPPQDPNTGDPLKSWVPLSHRRLFNVAVIVMHKRVPLPDSSPPSEQQVPVRNILSPRAIELEAVKPGTSVTANQVQLPITANQWIMLSAELRPPNPNSEQSPPQRWLHRWYRVVSVGRAESQPNQPNVLRLNLAGPDWPYNANPAVLQGPTYVTIVDKVVGVFQRTIELNIRSLTSL